MKVFKFDFTNTEPFGSFKESPDTLLLWRPLKSTLFRTCNWPASVNDNQLLLQMFDEISVNKKPLNGVYYFQIKSIDAFTDFASILFNMGIEHIFIEPEERLVNIEFLSSLGSLN